MDVTRANSSGEPQAVVTVDVPPRPGWFVHAVTAATTALATWTLGHFIASLFYWDFCEAFASLMFLPVVGALAIAQYLGTMRRQRACAMAVCGALLGCSGLAFFGGIVNVLEYCSEYKTVNLWIGQFFAVMFSIAICFAAAGWIDYRWVQRLRRYEAHADPTAAVVSRKRLRWYQFSLREWCGLSILLTLAVAFAGYDISTRRPRFAEHVAREQVLFNLPPGATDISYGDEVRGDFACEFTIDEAAFLSWAKEEIAASDPATHRVESLQRITGWVEVPRNVFVTLQQPHPISPVIITRGYVFESDNIGRTGSSYWYDADRNRAYEYHYFRY